MPGIGCVCAGGKVGGVLGGQHTARCGAVVRLGDMVGSASSVRSISIAFSIACSCFCKSRGCYAARLFCVLSEECKSLYAMTARREVPCPLRLHSEMHLPMGSGI